ncbi:hypothetical protein FRB99_008793, partial [Tulasnella sp. 403]
PLKAEFERLRRYLMPESATYHASALLRVQELVRTIPELTEKLSQFCGNVVDEDYALGVETMLQRGMEPTKRKETRPALNTSDIYDVEI